MAKPANGKTKRAEAAAPVNGATTSELIRSAHVTDADVARRAYDLYLARGRESGHDVEDWLQAEAIYEAPPNVSCRIVKVRHDNA